LDDYLNNKEDGKLNPFNDVIAYRMAFYSEIFDLAYSSEGSISITESYELPIYLRRFYLKKIIDIHERERQNLEKSQKQTSKVR